MVVVAESHVQEPRLGGSVALGGCVVGGDGYLGAFLEGYRVALQTLGVDHHVAGGVVEEEAQVEVLEGIVHQYQVHVASDPVQDVRVLGQMLVAA